MFVLFPILLVIPLFGFWLWMLNDLGKNRYITRQERNNWFLLIVFLNVFGALWYYLGEYRNRHL
jgi:hypothetical protein